MPVINRGDDYFAVVTYTGNGTSQTISGLRFQPDFVWIKGRSGATDHALYDAQRGVQSRLESNTTDAQVTSDGGVTAFNSDGFSIGSLAQVNTNGATYVAWCWKEGATQGFDIVTYSGSASAQNISHSLGVAPRMIIVKSRNTAGTDWAVYHASLGATRVINLDLTAAATTIAGPWNNTEPTSSVFTVGTGSGSGDTNLSGRTYVAYLFSEVAGFSKFGSYTGNGSSDGPFVFTGFRPRWVMVKSSSSVNNWLVWDSSRNTFNVVDLNLRPNTSDAESSEAALDLVSNGFKLRSTSGGWNGSGTTYIFAAFAENPFKLSLAR